MNTNNLNAAIYEKMATEQEKYRDWLKSVIASDKM
jgi:hypothetical protein